MEKERFYNATTRFFYFRDRANRPLVTVCRLSVDQKTVDGMRHVDAYGWSICSRKDNPCKTTGRVIAEGRAWSARFRKRYSWSVDATSQHVPAFLYDSVFARRKDALYVARDCGVFGRQNALPASVIRAERVLACLPPAMHPRPLSSFWTAEELAAAAQEGAQIGKTLGRSFDDPDNGEQKRNRAQCLGCHEVIESHAVHEFVRCTCGAIFVDGGKTYWRWGGDPSRFRRIADDSELRAGEK